MLSGRIPASSKFQQIIQWTTSHILMHNGFAECCLDDATSNLPDDATVYQRKPNGNMRVEPARKRSSALEMIRRSLGRTRGLTKTAT